MTSIARPQVRQRDRGDALGASEESRVAKVGHIPDSPRRWQSTPRCRWLSSAASGRITRDFVGLCTNAELHTAQLPLFSAARVRCITTTTCEGGRSNRCRPAEARPAKRSSEP